MRFYDKPTYWKGVEEEMALSDSEQRTLKQIRDNMIATDKPNSGWHSNYYTLPGGASELQDLIEYKNMNFSVGNIFKACYRLGECDHSDAIRDVQKILFFGERLLKQLERDNEPS